MSKLSGPQVKVVWAKVKGYPWWPALMNMTNEYSEQSKERLIVRFLGQDSHAQVKSDMVKDFSTHFQQHSHMKSKKLLKAIRIARELDDDIVKSSNTLYFDSQTILDSKKDHDKTSADYQTKAIDGFPHTELSEKGQAPKEQSHVETLQMHQCPSHQEELSGELQPPPARKSRSVRCEQQINRIPLRKYEEITLEGRIVELMNNLKIGRECNNDMQRILKRLSKIKPKEVMNRYILSGLMALQKLVVGSTITNTAAVQAQLAEHICSVKLQAIQLLSQTEGIRQELIEQEESSMEDLGERPTVKSRKREIVRTIHHILKIRQPGLQRERFKEWSLAIYKGWEDFVGDVADPINQVRTVTRLLRQLRTLPAQVITSGNCIEVLKQHLADTVVA